MELRRIIRLYILPLWLIAYGGNMFATGTTLELHFCKGRLARIGGLSIPGQACVCKAKEEALCALPPCCRALQTAKARITKDKKTSKSCCKDKQVTVKSASAQKGQDFVSHFFGPPPAPATPYSFFSWRALPLFPTPRFVRFLFQRPPPPFLKRYLRFCTLRN